MVKKKKVVKKFIKKKSVKKSSSESSVSKKDFEAFKFGIQRLKELESELKSLDTRGFTKDAQAIKSKLKSVSEIPNIEKSLKSLRAKIHGKYKPQRKKKSPIKEIHKDIEEVKEDLQKFRKSRKESFEDIKDEIKKLGKKKKSNIPLDSGVDALVDTNFNDFLVSVKKSLSERVRNREEEMDGVLKRDLNKREDKYKKKHDFLLKDFDRHKKKVEEEYSGKYKKKIESELHKEVSQNFNRMLKDKLNKEKVELGKTYKAQLKQHAEDELSKRESILGEKTRKVLSEKMNVLESQFAKKVEEENKKENVTKAELDRQKKELGKSRQDFILKKKDEEKKMRDKLVEEEHKQLNSEIVKKEVILRRQLQEEYELKLKKQVNDHEQELKKRKLDLELEMQKKIKQLLN